MSVVGCRTADGEHEGNKDTAKSRFAGYQSVVADPHRKSLALREQVLRETIARDSYWIEGNWGECLWSLAALYLNEKTDRVNDWLLGSAKAYCAAMEAEATGSVFAPGKSPWAYFALADYTRMLCLFRADSPHFPGRLRPETEAAMKEALWWLVKSRSRVAEASLDHLLVHHGTENPVVEKTRGGRPQHPHWSFQHKNVLFMQRITPQRGGMGSYSTGRMSIRFHGHGLQKIEKDGWIFASNGKAFVAVKFLDGNYSWGKTAEVAHPANFESGQATRFLLHAGDSASFRSLDAFQATVLDNPLTVERDRVEYLPDSNAPRLECFRYVVDRFREFKLPRVDGEPIDLRPDWTYKSPYLNGRFGDDRIRVTVGLIQRVYDFGKGI